jgi:hypothetical protein
MRAATLLLFAACLPNPQSVAERREGFDRRGLEGVVLLRSLPPMTEVHAIFDGPIELLGYQCEPQLLAPGDRAKITLYWTAQESVGEDLEVFVHGDAADGSRRLHGDHLPAEGRYPTDVWRPGEFVVDRFSLDIPRDYAPTSVSLFMGLYRNESRVLLREPGSRPADRENRSRVIDLSLHRSAVVDPGVGE